VQVVPMRLREGDDASCLNLNRAQTPQLLGVQPELLNDYGGSLRESVKARLPEAVDAGLAILGDWGIEYRKRDKPLENAELTGPDAINMDEYEAGRPDTKETWR